MEAKENQHTTTKYTIFPQNQRGHCSITKSHNWKNNPIIFNGIKRKRDFDKEQDYKMDHHGNKENCHMNDRKRNIDIKKNQRLYRPFPTNLLMPLSSRALRCSKEQQRIKIQCSNCSSSRLPIRTRQLNGEIEQSELLTRRLAI